jgi:hypothetical protein
LSPPPFCHSSESWNLHNIRQATLVIPAKAGTPRTIYEATLVIPAKAGTPRTIYEATLVIPAKAGTSRTIYEATLVIPAKAGTQLRILSPRKREPPEIRLFVQAAYQYSQCLNVEI